MSGNIPNPVEAFVSGIASTFWRFPLALVLVFAAYLGASPWDSSLELLVAWIPVSLGLIFYWAKFGMWAFAGLLSLGGLVLGLYFFLQDVEAHASLLAMLTGAVIYYLPLGFEGGQWKRALLIYAAIVVTFWLLPHHLSRRAAARKVEPDEPGAD